MAIWQMDGLVINGSSFFSRALVGWHIANESSDYNGDGRSDILWHNDNGQVYEWQMDGVTINPAVRWWDRPQRTG